MYMTSPDRPSQGSEQGSNPQDGAARRRDIDCAPREGGRGGEAGQTCRGRGTPEPRDSARTDERAGR